MNRSLALVAIVTCIAANSFTGAEVRASDRAQPMKFALRQQGPEAACTDHCKLYIAASGAITADTPAQFQAFAKNRKLAGAVVVLESEGGSVHGAIALGREIRRLGLDTTVGRLTDLKSSGNGIQRATLSPRTDCESMCSFVLLSGVHRWVSPESRVMVHQIWLGDRREDPIAANYSAEDLVLVQRDIGKLAMYTAEMGASMDILDLSLRIPPWEPMHVMTRDEIQRMRVVTETPDNSSAATIASSPSKPLVQPQPESVRLTNGVDVGELSDRTWEIVDRSGAAALARHYPLTLKGDEIGGFDLLVSCSTNKASYDAVYIERRHDTDEAPMPKIVQSVTLRAAGEQAALQVVSSERHDDELVTMATGRIPAALVEGFGADGNHSMMVETTADKLNTAIRIGNTGVAQNLPRLTKACGALVPQQRADATPAK